MTPQDVPAVSTVLSLAADQLKRLAQFNEAIRPTRRERDRAAILINGSKAPWADIIAVVFGTLVLIQAKRYTTVTLGTMDVVRELHKMGCRAPVVVLGEWIRVHEASKTPAEKKDMLERLAGEMGSDPAAIAALAKRPGWAELAKPAPRGVHVAKTMPKYSPHPEFTVSAALSGLKRAYVVAAVGNVDALGPAVLEQLGAETEGPVLLLHSPLEVARGHRLRGYYPLTVSCEEQYRVSSAPVLPDYFRDILKEPWV